MPIPKKSDNHPVAEKHLPEDWPRTASERADNTAVKSVMALEHQRYRVLAVTARVWVSLSKQQQQRGSNNGKKVANTESKQSTTAKKLKQTAKLRQAAESKRGKAKRAMQSNRQGKEARQQAMQ